MNAKEKEEKTIQRSMKMDDKYSHITLENLFDKIIEMQVVNPKMICDSFDAILEHTRRINVLPCIVITTENGYDRSYYVESHFDITFPIFEVRAIIHRNGSK